MTSPAAYEHSDEICPNCRRPMTTRACGREEHREAHAAFVANLPGKAPKGAGASTRAYRKAGAIGNRHGSKGRKSPKKVRHSWQG